MRQNFKCNKSQSGAILILTSFVIVIMLGITALVVDISHLHVVKEEMQNAADSAALRGANFLELNDNGDPISPGSASTLSITKANDAAVVHQVLKQNLITSELSIRTGYWDWASSSLVNTRSNTRPPAIEVLVNKSNVALFFARIFGFNQTDLTVKSIAIAPSPDTVERGTLMLPLAISECVFAQLLLGATIDIGKSSSSGSCSPQGAWATLNGNNSVDYLTGIIDGSNTQALAKVGDTVTIANPSAIQPPVLSGINSCRNSTCNYSVLPVISSIGAPNSTRPINGFACIKVIEAITAGSEKFVKATLSSGCQSGFFSGAPGPNYGVYVPSKLIY